MGLPSILRPRPRRRSPSSEPEKHSSAVTPTSPASYTDQDATTTANTISASASISGPPPYNLPKSTMKRITRTRRYFSFSASFSYLLAWIFLILVLIGNTPGTPVLESIYFFKLNLADIIPMSVPNASLINSIAQSIGLHDFYQVGLWNFCEGYLNVGVTYCSKPKALYWFNPVEILMSELLAGATIALPTQVITILSVLRITSQIMFGFFLTACILAFLLVLLSPLATSSKWWSLPLTVAAFLVTLFTVSASIIGTVISVAFKYAAEAQSDLNIHVELGTKMLIFTWLAAGFTVWGFAVHAGMGCCCVSKRDLKTGRRTIIFDQSGKEGGERSRDRVAPRTLMIRDDVRGRY
ncbi:SUR7 family protein pun1 [Podospora fimiseda]|uniref:SUR7 family protein pun1 n=1 Tax=Podospora fimiseda TaxID=252190 RepID=A0AAN7BTG5_9PEZI|nr:SUR7 family protein pun1 [Podospora fimiseda]